MLKRLLSKRKRRQRLLQKKRPARREERRRRKRRRLLFQRLQLQRRKRSRNSFTDQKQLSLLLDLPLLISLQLLQRRPNKKHQSLLQKRSNQSQLSLSRSPSKPRKNKRKKRKLQDLKPISNPLHLTSQLLQSKISLKSPRSLKRRAKILSNSSLSPRKLRSPSFRSTLTSKRPSQPLFRKRMLSFKSN